MQCFENQYIAYSSFIIKIFIITNTYRFHFNTYYFLYLRAYIQKTFKN